MTDETSPTGERLPATIGRYQITGVLGFGAMGAVYKAFDPLIKRTLAIKTIRLDVPESSPQHRTFIERFYQEARISGTLSHPNIVTLFDVGEEGGRPFLAMEYIDGRTIASFIEEGFRFKPEKVVAIVSQVASALDYAHTRGVVHRDIKPSNLMLYEGEKVKVTDFGIAKLVDADITHAGALVGTPSYMSPEQAMGEKLDGRSDIFSLGVCAFEMLSGVQPFPGSNVTAILYKLVHTDPVEPPELEANGLIPQKWREVFHKVLAKKPVNRYPLASEFVRDLEVCLGSWFAGLEQTIVTASGAGAASGAATPSPLDADSAPVAASPAIDDEPATVRIVPGRPEGTLPAAAAPAAAAKPTPTAVPLPGARRPRAGVLTPAGLDDAQTVRLSAHTLPPVAPGPAPARPGDDEAMAATVRIRASDVAAAAKTPAAALPAPTAVAAAPSAEPDETPATILMGASALAAAIEPPPSQAAATLPPLPPPAAPLEPQAPATESLAQPTEALPRPALPRPAALPRGWGWIAAGGAALVVVIGAVALVSWRRSRVEPVAPPVSLATPAATAPPVATPAPTAPTAAPPAGVGVLHVESDPPGARVRVNGNPSGTTPLELTALPLGDYEVRFELKGYEQQSRRASLTDAAPTAELRARLKKAAPVMGNADIVSVPPGAAVTVDGMSAGRTPLSRVVLAPGPHSVQLALEGHEPWSGEIRVDPRAVARLEVPLRALPKAPPTPEPVDPSRVYLENEVDAKARRLSGSTPSYPSTASRLKSGQRVSVLVRFVVTSAGEIGDVTVVESGGKAVDEVVVSAVRKWRFEPATKRGVKVNSQAVFRQTFLGG